MRQAARGSAPGLFPLALLPVVWLALYGTRRQLFVLLLLVAAGGVGLAVGHWRRANPDTVEYLEQLDRAPAPPVASAPQPPVRARDARSAADREPRPARRSRMPHGVPAAPPADTPTESSSDDDLDADRATETDSSSW